MPRFRVETTETTTITRETWVYADNETDAEHIVSEQDWREFAQVSESGSAEIAFVESVD